MIGELEPDKQWTQLPLFTNKLTKFSNTTQTLSIKPLSQLVGIITEHNHSKDMNNRYISIF